MNPITAGCLLFGYILTYAAIANHGRFALSPWTGVTHDAYRDEVDTVAKGKKA